MSALHYNCNTMCGLMGNFEALLCTCKKQWHRQDGDWVYWYFEKFLVTHISGWEQYRSRRDNVMGTKTRKTVSDRTNP